MSVFKRIFDERFLEYRRRSTGAAGLVGAAVAVGLFEYRLVVDHSWNMDLLAVALAMVAAKLGLMAWYALRG